MSSALAAIERIKTAREQRRHSAEHLRRVKSEASAAEEACVAARGSARLIRRQHARHTPRAHFSAQVRRAARRL